MAVHGAVIRGIREDHLGEFALEKTGIGLRVAGIAAQSAMLVHEPEIANLAHGRVGDCRDRISWVILDGWLCRTVQDEVDLGGLEAG